MNIKERTMPHVIGREAPCDADRSLLLGLSFELFVGEHLHRTDGDEGECQESLDDP
jgi:hypothetical protein